MSYLNDIGQFSAQMQGLAALLGLIATLAVFAFQQRRLVNVQKQETYQRLELASNEVFRFSATHAAALAPYQTLENDAGMDVEQTPVDNAVADSYMYQTLNLFEMAARLRQAEFIEHEIFGSWVIWYYSLLESWYFRNRWLEIRPNYTKEIRLIFDEPVRTFNVKTPDSDRKKQFFTHVSEVLKCAVIRKWLDN